MGGQLRIKVRGGTDDGRVRQLAAQLVGNGVLQKQQLCLAAGDTHLIEASVLLHKGQGIVKHGQKVFLDIGCLGQGGGGFCKLLLHQIRHSPSQKALLVVKMGVKCGPVYHGPLTDVHYGNLGDRSLLQQGEQRFRKEFPCPSLTQIRLTGD